MFELDMVHPSMSDLSTVVCARNPVSNASKITRVQHLDGPRQGLQCFHQSVWQPR